MSLPTGWPPRPATGLRSIRVFLSGTSLTANFADNAYLFNSITGANTFLPTPIVPEPLGPGLTPTAVGTTQTTGVPMGGGSPVERQLSPPPPGFVSPVAPTTTPMIWTHELRIYNDGTGILEFSFDGTNIHGRIFAGENAHYTFRFEAGISLRYASGSASGAWRVEGW
jgi:hypothetical protein